MEISCFEGRSVAAKRKLIHGLFDLIERHHGMHAEDIEITIIETPRWNLGIRGVTGDEFVVTYPVGI